jgi:hypothetical protein
MAQIEDQHFMLRANTGTGEQEKASQESKDRYGYIAYVMEELKFIEHWRSCLRYPASARTGGYAK